MAKVYLYIVLGFCVILLSRFEYVGCVGKLQQHVFVSLGTGNDGTSAINNRSYYCGSNVKLSCTLISDVILNIARWVKYENGMSTVLNFKPVSNDENIMLDIDVNNDGLYSCQYDQYVSVPMYTFNISITIEGSIKGCQNTSVSHDTSTIGAHFPGLNPLIYTIVSAVFLGILILVSIITCWIRSRKNSRLRSLLPQESPQDYLDYIQQGEFTPLTTSEFVASLRERPPTYNESEVIQRQLTEEGPTDPPPLPPRNRGSPIEEQHNSSRDPLGNLDTTEVLIENPNTSSNMTTPLPNLFPDDFTLSFLLDDLNTLQQPRPLIDEDLEENDLNNSSETTNLLVGVIPSINNAVV